MAETLTVEQLMHEAAYWACVLPNQLRYRLPHEDWELAKSYIRRAHKLRELAVA